MTPRRAALFRRLRRLAEPFMRLSREGRLLTTTACGAAALCMDVGRTEAHVLLLGVVSLLVASVFASRWSSLDGVEVGARAARRVSVGEPLSVAVVLHNHGREDHHDLRVEMPRVSRDAEWVVAPTTLPRLGAGATERTEAKVRFARRGERVMGPIRVASLVPLGLAQGAAIETAPMRLVVVPRLARVVRVTTPRNQHRISGGAPRPARTGDATELLGVRPYRPGDQVRDLHAKSWARVGFPVVREHQEEFLTRVGLVLDVDAAADPTLFGAATDARLEAGLSLAAGVIAALGKGDTLVDVLVVGDRAHALAAGRGAAVVDRALEALALVRSGPPLDHTRALAALAPFLDRLSSVVVVALAWDAERERLARALRARGVGCVVLVASTDARRTDQATFVAEGAITRGEALEL